LHTDFYNIGGYILFGFEDDRQSLKGWLGVAEDAAPDGWARAIQPRELTESATA
jgi:hypothetical protein